MKNLNLNSLIGVGNVIQTTLAPFQSQKVIENPNDKAGLVVEIQTYTGTIKIPYENDIPFHGKAKHKLKRRFATPEELTDDEYLDFLLGFEANQLNIEELEARANWVEEKARLQEEARLEKLRKEEEKEYLARKEERERKQLEQLEKQRIEEEKNRVWILGEVEKLKKTGVWNPSPGPNGEVLTKDLFWKKLIHISNLNEEDKQKLLKINFYDGTNVDLVAMNILNILRILMYEYTTLEIAAMFIYVISSTAPNPLTATSFGLFVVLSGFFITGEISKSILSSIESKLTDINKMSHQAYSEIFDIKIKFSVALDTPKKYFETFYVLNRDNHEALNDWRSSGKLYENLQITKENFINLLTKLKADYKYALRNLDLVIRGPLINIFEVQINEFIYKLKYEVNTYWKMYNFIKTFMFGSMER